MAALQMAKVRFGSLDCSADEEVPDVSGAGLMTPLQVVDDADSTPPGLGDGMSRCSSASTVNTMAPGDSDADTDPVQEPPASDRAQSSSEVPGLPPPPLLGHYAGPMAPAVAAAPGLAGVRAGPSVAAVAAVPRPKAGAGDGRPLSGAHERRRVQDRKWRPVRNTTPLETTPAQQEAKPALRSDVLNNRVDVGNIGWMFGNWGSRASNQEVQHRIDLQLKRAPAHIIGVCEVEQPTETMLSSAAVAAEEEGPGLLQRAGYRYQCIRGNEEKSNMLAIREETGTLTFLYWDRREVGQYKVKNNHTAIAYSRTLVCQADLELNVGFFGRKMVIAVVHLHNKVANHDTGFRKEQHAFWPRLKQTLLEWNVDVLMGDFNMSLWKVVPELRNLGLDIALVAWYPWKSRDGSAMCDSCGIFLVNKSPEAEVAAKLSDLHGNNELGILYSCDRGFAGPRSGPYDVFSGNAGPGQPLSVFLPKAADLYEKLEPSLRHGRPAVAVAATQQAADQAAKARGKGKGAEGGHRSVLKTKEKRLKAEHWLTSGENHKGSHFPLCVFTNNVGRRSEEAFCARKLKQAARPKKPKE